MGGGNTDDRSFAHQWEEVIQMIGALPTNGKRYSMQGGRIWQFVKLLEGVGQTPGQRSSTWRWVL